MVLEGQNMDAAPGLPNDKLWAATVTNKGRAAKGEAPKIEKKNWGGSKARVSTIRVLSLQTLGPSILMKSTRILKKIP